MWDLSSWVSEVGLVTSLGLINCSSEWETQRPARTCTCMLVSLPLMCSKYLQNSQTSSKVGNVELAIAGNVCCIHLGTFCFFPSLPSATRCVGDSCNLCIEYDVDAKINTPVSDPCAFLLPRIPVRRPLSADLSGSDVRVCQEDPE